MSKGLKCIGGVANGRILSVKDGQNVVEFRSMAERPRVRDFDPSKALEAVAVSYISHLYELDRVQSDDALIEFLRPVGMSTLAALRSVLAP